MTTMSHINAEARYNQKHSAWVMANCKVLGTLLHIHVLHVHIHVLHYASCHIQFWKVTLDYGQIASELMINVQTHGNDANLHVLANKVPNLSLSITVTTKCFNRMHCILTF